MSEAEHERIPPGSDFVCNSVKARYMIEQNNLVLTVSTAYTVCDPYQTTDQCELQLPDLQIWIWKRKCIVNKSNFCSVILHERISPFPAFTPPVRERSRRVVPATTFSRPLPESLLALKWNRRVTLALNFLLTHPKRAGLQCW